MENDKKYVPVFTKLEEVYPDLNGSIKNKHEPRFITLRDRFKQQYGVPPTLASCHTGVVQETGQIIEGHVPANAVRKMLASPSVKGVSAPGMPMNSPGMGEMDGNLVTVDFQGRAFSRD